MSQYDFQILNKKIVSCNISISENMPQKLKISVNFNAKLGLPEDENDRSVLLNTTLYVQSEEKEIDATLVSYVVIGLSENPNDYNDPDFKQELMGIVIPLLLESFDGILVTMGYDKLNLEEHQKTVISD